MDPNISQNKSTKMYWIMFILAVLLVVAFVYIKLSRQPEKTTNDTNQTTNTPMPTVKLSNTVMNLGVSAETEKQVGKELTVELTGDSDNINIVGFDTLVNYDVDGFDLVRVMSKLPDFKVFNFVKEGYVSLTSTKAIDQEETATPSSSIFTNTPLIELVFMPKKAGKYSFDIGQVIGKESSKYVNDKTEIIYPKVNGVSVEIN